MRSKTSCFNGGIAKNFLRRFWPLWLGYFLILLLVPLVLFSRLRSFDPLNDLSPGLDFILGSSRTPLLFLSLLMGVLTAMAMFGFLYNSRSCGLLNCLPVDRSTLFFTAGLTGGLALLSADMLACGVTALLCTSGYLNPGHVLEFFAMLVLSKAFFYGFAVFCAMLTGNLLILPCVYLVLNFTAIVAELCIRDILSKVIFGLTAHDFRLTFLSPFALMLEKLGVAYTKWPYEVRYTGLETMAIYALVGLVFLCLAWRLFLRRHMETAGDTVAFRVLKPIFQYCMCFGSAIVFADIVYAIADMRVSGRPAALFLLFLLLVGAFLGYFAARMLIDRTLRVFRGHWKGFWIGAALIVLLLGACEFDLFGIEKHVPAADKVEMVVLDGVELKEQDNLEKVRTLHQSLIAHKDRHESLAAGGGGEYVSTTEKGTRISRHAEFVYVLKDGRTFQRLYAVCGDDADIADPDSDLRRFEDLLNCQEALEFRCTLAYPLAAENIVYAGLELSRTDDKGVLINTDSVNLSADELIDFWQNGVLADMAEGHIARRTVCDMERGWSYTNAQLYLCITGDLEAYQQSGGDVRQQQWLNVQIATDSVHCLDWIEEHTGVRPAALNGASAEEPVRVW